MLLSELRVNFLMLCIISVGIQGSVIREPSKDVEEDYYWRPYSGVIPNDALPGGLNAEGQTTYIGQTYFTDIVLIPGQLDESTKTLYYAMNGDEHTTTQNVKIFCTRHPENFEWIKTDVEKMRFLRQKHLPQGGFDDHYPLLIGRKTSNNQLIVGKVSVHKDYEAMSFAVGGRANYGKDNFEVLSYNPKPFDSGITLKIERPMAIKNDDSKCESKVYNINFH